MLKHITSLINLFVWSKKGTGGCIQSLWGGRSNVAMVDLLSGEVVQFSLFLRLEWNTAVAIGYEGRFSCNGPSLDSSSVIRKKNSGKKVSGR